MLLYLPHYFLLLHTDFCPFWAFSHSLSSSLRLKLIGFWLFHLNNGRHHKKRRVIRKTGEVHRLPPCLTETLAAGPFLSGHSFCWDALLYDSVSLDSNYIILSPYPSGLVASPWAFLSLLIPYLCLPSYIEPSIKFSSVKHF